MFVHSVYIINKIHKYIYFLLEFNKWAIQDLDYYKRVLYYFLF
jgi:hypothetical protein